MSLADYRVGLRSFLLADEQIAAVVGERVYALRLPQGEMRTSIVYKTISDIGDHHMQGPSGLARPRVQVDAWAQSLDDAVSLGRIIKSRLDGYRGVWTAAGGDQAQVSGVFFDTRREDYDAEAKLYRSGSDYLIWLQER